MWEFGLLLLLVAVLGVFLAQRFVPRGPRSELLSGTLLVTGVSPRPDADGEQFVTIAGVINGPNVNEHAVYARLAVNVDQWPTMANSTRWCTRRRIRTTGNSHRPKHPRPSFTIRHTVAWHHL